MAVFLFVFIKAALVYLPTTHFVALRPSFPFWEALYFQIFPLKPAPLCKLFTAPTSLSFFFSLTLALSSPLCPLLHLFFYLNLSGRNCLLSFCTIRLQWVPGHSFFVGNDTADELARQGALSVPSAIPCSLSPLVLRIPSFLFWDWRCKI